MSAPRHPVNYRIAPLGREWCVYSDSEAALPTNGLIYTKWDLRTAREWRDERRRRKTIVTCPELDALD